MEYAFKEDTIIKVAENSTLTDSNVLAISAGDMVVIVEDENTLIVYPNHF